MSLSLRSLSDSDVLSRTLALTRRERAVTLQVLLHLNEIEQRKLHLKQGYASMFDYCTNSLGYSSSAAGRRIQTARCIARYPEVYALLEKNEVNLTTVSEASRVIRPDNKHGLLARIRGKSQRDVKAIVAEYEPRESRPRDEVRPMVIKTPPRLTVGPLSVLATAGTAAAGSPEHASEVADACEMSAYSRSGSAAHSPAGRPAGPGATCGAALLETIHVIKFPAGEAFMKKVARVKSLAWHRLPPNPTFEQVFELALDVLIEKEDPAKRHERREGKKCSDSSREPATSREEQPQAKTAPNARYVPASVRDQVFVRDRGRCTYVGPNGNRCASTRALQVDHIRPVARGGASTCDNLRLLCADHNRLEAERLLGPRGHPGAS